MRAAIAWAALLALTSCNSPTTPEIEIPAGRLFGVVTIGPNCPGPQECPTPPSAYSERKILIYNASRSTLLFTVDIASNGSYASDLVAGTYIVDFRGVGIDRSSDVPATVQIRANDGTRLDVRIDTGLR